MKVPFANRDSRGANYQSARAALYLGRAMQRELLGEGT